MKTRLPDIISDLLSEIPRNLASATKTLPEELYPSYFVDYCYSI